MKKLTKQKYYDWQKTMSYDAELSMIIGARGIGKTYGLRKFCINECIKKGYRYCEIVRYQNALKSFKSGYFDKMATNDEFCDFDFKVEKDFGLYRAKNDKDGKWVKLVYFLALTAEQNYKTQTFAQIKRIIFDEFIIDRHDRYKRYLQNEVSKLGNLIDTVSRERADEDCIKPRVYLLGNSLDAFNPYFIRYNVTLPTLKGFSWYDKKRVLLHYVDSADYSRDKGLKTVAGHILQGLASGDVSTKTNFCYPTKAI